MISVDTKKKELIGDFKNVGREWQPKGEPVNVRGHDFADPELGKANPYGIYDVQRNEGWVSVGTDHDTAEFAVSSIGHWWRRLGRRTYPEATELLITADGGGSNSSRSRPCIRSMSPVLPSVIVMRREASSDQEAAHTLSVEVRSIFE